MNLGKIEDGFFVTTQIMPEHFAMLAEQGIKTIVNNRPDGERGFYPADAEMAELAKNNGIKYHFIPVNPMSLTMETVDTFANSIKAATRPVVAYCASGRRSAMLWAMVNASSKNADEIISACAAQGHDLSQMRPMLMQMAQAA